MQRNLFGFEHSVNTCHLRYGDACDSALVQGNICHICQRYIGNKLLQASTMGLVIRKSGGRFVQHEQYNSFCFISSGHTSFLVLLM